MVETAERCSPADYRLQVWPLIEPGSFLYLLFREAYSSRDSRHLLPTGHRMPFIVSSLRSRWGTGTLHALPSRKTWSSSIVLRRCISSSEEAAASQTDRRAAHLSVGIARLSRNEMFSPRRANSFMTPDALEKECARSRGLVKT